MSELIPGDWQCPKCVFRLHKAKLFAGDGTVAVDRATVREVCPNDGATLEPAYEHPDDQLIDTEDCCREASCPECRGMGFVVIGWHYRDEPGHIQPLGVHGERGGRR
jgi:hypothetical protein